MRCYHSFFITSFVIIGLVSSAIGDDPYYIYDGRQIPVSVDTTKMVLALREGEVVNVGSFIGGLSRVRSYVARHNGYEELYICSLTVSHDYFQYLDTVRAVTAVRYAGPLYKDGSGKDLFATDLICAGFDPTLDSMTIDSILQHNGVEAVAEIMHNAWSARNVQPGVRGTLATANALAAEPGVEFAEPDFMGSVEVFSYKAYDYFHPRNLQIKEVIGEFNERSVWDFARVDRPCTVAILDDGLISHEDMPDSRLVQGKDCFGSRLTYPWALTAHGMGCAGIIGASHTTDSTQGYYSNSGVISMNPHSLLMPIRMIDSLGVAVVHSLEAEGIRYAWTHGADILNCSWGNPRLGAGSTIVDLALDSAYTYGRNGRGCLIIASTGNDADWQQLWYDSVWVSWPARLECCFAVGAVELRDVPTGQFASFSQFGPELDMVAPASGPGFINGYMWTLDQMGSYGYNPDGVIGLIGLWDCPPTAPNNQNYDCHFGGTSAAAPVVSGAASLVLAYNDTLTASTVYDILRHSAVPVVGSVPSDTFGWGEVDAFRAVLSLARGDADNNGSVDITDLTRLIDYWFISFEPPFPTPLLGDCNCDGQVEASGDLTYMVNFLFLEGPPPVIPCFHFEVP